MVIDRRFLIEEDRRRGQAGDRRPARAAEGHAARASATSCATCGQCQPDDDRARRAGGPRGGAAHRRGARAASPDYVVSPGTYDQKHIDRIGQLHDCIAYGPGILDLAHQPDEWVGIDRHGRIPPR